MANQKMHDDEVATSPRLVRQLVAAQFPEWRGLAVIPVASAGTVNAIYRLGDDMAVRLPRVVGGTREIEKLSAWLPKLASHLPLAIPEPLVVGEPGHGFPWAWSIHRWLEGDPATAAHIEDPRQAAADLGRFVAALQRIDRSGGPPAGPTTGARGLPLRVLDSAVRRALVQLQGTLDTEAAAAAWESALEAPEWDRSPAWFHGDLLVGNLLVRDGRLSAVIDCGLMGVGDPACDVMAAWAYVTAASRDAFRAELRFDDAMWARGRGWALYVGLLGLPYYRTTNPVFAAVCQRAIDEVLADPG